LADARVCAKKAFRRTKDPRDRRHGPLAQDVALFFALSMRENFSCPGSAFVLGFFLSSRCDSGRAMQQAVKRIGIVLAVVVAVLCLASAEFPELLTLTDQTSNDFAILDSSICTASQPDGAGMAGDVQVHCLARPSAEISARGTAALPRITLERPGRDLLRLFSILRT
jgi:hypothetical protein